MAHIGQELSLSPIGGFGSLLGLAQHRLVLFLLGDIGDESMPQHTAIRLALGKRVAIAPAHYPVSQGNAKFAFPLLQSFRRFKQGGSKPLQIIWMHLVKEHPGIATDLFRFQLKH